MSRIRRAWRILIREPGRVLLLGILLIPFGFLLSFCFVGIPLLAFVLGSLAAALVRNARDARGRQSEPASGPGWAGPLTLFGLALVFLGPLASWSALGSFVSDDLLRGLSTLVGPALIGAAIAPMALAPLAAAGGIRGLMPALRRSLDLTAPLGARRLAIRGALAGALLGCPTLVWAAIADGVARPNPTYLLPAIFASIVAFGAVLVFGLALLADGYVELSPSAPAPTSDHVSRRLRMPALLVVPIVMVCATVIALAALTPTRARELLPPEYPDTPDLRSRTATLPGSDVEARIDGRDVVIEAPDGGGAGRVPMPFGMRDGSGLSIHDGPSFGGAPRTYAVVVAGPSDHPRAAVVIVDSDGVRRDDGLDARVLGRLGVLGGGALTLGLLLMLLLAFRLALDLGEARTLDAPDLRAPGGGRRKALAGKLRLAEGSEVRAQRRALSVDGEAWLEAEGGALRLRLPARGSCALGGPEHPMEGQPLVLISRFAAGLPTNLRESAKPWPDDGLLVLGTIADAHDALARRALHLAARIALPATLCVLAAMGVLLWAL